MAWKPDLESLFNDEVVTDNINNTVLQTEKYFPPRPREHVESALRRLKLQEEEENKKKEEKAEQIAREENKAKQENKAEEENESDGKRKEKKIVQIKSKDRRAIFNMLDDHAKIPERHFQLDAALPDVIPEFPDFSVDQSHVENNLCSDFIETEKESIQMMRNLGMGSGKSCYLDVNRVISTHKTTSCIIFPTSKYAIPLLMDESFFKFSISSEKKIDEIEDNMPALNLEPEKWTYENDAFAKAILESKGKHLEKVEDEWEQYINNFPKVPTKESVPAPAPESSLKKPKRKRGKRKNNKQNNENENSQFNVDVRPENTQGDHSHTPQVKSKKSKKRPTYKKLELF